MILDIRPAFRFLLMSDSAVSALVGARVFRNRMPQGVRLPSLVYTRISSIGDHHMEGPSGLAQVRFQVDAWHQSEDGADILADAAKFRLDGFRGSASDGQSPASFIKIQGIFFDSENDGDYDEPSKMYKTSRDYFVKFEER